MPRPPIRVELRVGCLGEGAVRDSSLSRRRRPVHGRADERVAERAPLADLEEASLLGRIARLDAQTQLRCCAEEQERIAKRLGRGDNEQPSRVGR